MAHHDTVYSYRFVKYAIQTFDLPRSACKVPHHHYPASDADSVQSVGECPGAPYVNDEVDSAIAELVRLPAPLLVCSVVDPRVRSELLCTFKLRIATGSDDDFQLKGFCELQAEQAHSSGALQKNTGARL
eukprot:CAMPEP_0167783384 /NCGR_PEP_ID=MMETSP0111_2-20121227/7040_1 /TAXON_ID=91324 /ORGANISM="Lotharella globosa, Strain CCCM811" /LENGTH=129 /DNA_ID=CAMNT_0007674315 /DNA_START=340 /DNA_END=729 /DNA_ORIENTATION=-